MFHRWHTSDDNESGFSESCLVCGVICDVPADRANSAHIPIGDIRSVIPFCPGVPEPLPLPDHHHQPPTRNMVREYPESHHWYVTGRDPFRSDETGQFLGGYCDRIACHWCNATMDLHTMPSSVPTYCERY